MESTFNATQYEAAKVIVNTCKELTIPLTELDLFKFPAADGILPGYYPTPYLIRTYGRDLVTGDELSYLSDAAAELGVFKVMADSAVVYRDDRRLQMIDRYLGPAGYHLPIPKNNNGEYVECIYGFDIFSFTHYGYYFFHNKRWQEALSGIVRFKRGTSGECRRFDCFSGIVTPDGKGVVASTAVHAADAPQKTEVLFGYLYRKENKNRGQNRIRTHLGSGLGPRF